MPFKFFILFSLLNVGGTVAHPYQHLIPEGYKKISTTQGDLNKDQTQDLVIVAENEAGQRKLIITFTINSAYKKVLEIDGILMSKTEGGVMGDPLMEPKIDRGSLVISHYGGSRQRWFYTERFRYQKNKKGQLDFYLIGHTQGTEDTLHPGSAKQTDHNLLTGDVVVQTRDQNDKEHMTKSKKPIKNLISIKNYKRFDSSL